MSKDIRWQQRFQNFQKAFLKLEKSLAEVDIMNGGVSYLDLIRIKSVFDDSDLPYTVDVLYYPEIRNKELKAHIDRIGKPFYERKVLANSSFGN